METKPLPSREVHLEIENLSLKLHIMKGNLATLQTKFQGFVDAVFLQAGLSKDDWALDLDRGVFVEKKDS
jgi:hypothetical protein